MKKCTRYTATGGGEIITGEGRLRLAFRLPCEVLPGETTSDFVATSRPYKIAGQGENPAKAVESLRGVLLAAFTHALNGNYLDTQLPSPSWTKSIINESEAIGMIERWNPTEGFVILRCFA